MTLLVKWFNSIERPAELFLQMPLAPHALRRTQQQREKNGIPPWTRATSRIEGKPMIAVRCNRDRTIRKFKRFLSGIARRFVIFITDSRCLGMRFGIA
jgi:hypothetical protein